MGVAYHAPSHVETESHVRPCAAPELCNNDAMPAVQNLYIIFKQKQKMYMHILYTYAHILCSCAFYIQLYK